MLRDIEMILKITLYKSDKTNIEIEGELLEEIATDLQTVEDKDIELIKWDRSPSHGNGVLLVFHKLSTVKNYLKAQIESGKNTKRLSLVQTESEVTHE